MSDTLASNLADGIDRASVSFRRPWCLFVSISFGLVVLFVGGGPLAATLSEQSRVIVYHAKVGAGSTAPLLAASSPPPPPPSTSSQVATATSSTSTTAPAKASRSPSVCGDGVCDAPSETISSCFADCPGPSTDASCGEELHSDPQGNAVVDGRGHHVKSAAECCAACAAHAAKHPTRPCNSWVFCFLPHCWSADNGNTHLFGECWLKWQTDPAHPLYGQRGAYSEKYRKDRWNLHLAGVYPDDKESVKAMTPFGIVPGSRRNVTVPTHVAWIGGVMGAKVDRTVRWTTDSDGTMRSNTGEVIVDYRPWETREMNLKRGVKPEQIKF